MMMNLPQWLEPLRRFLDLGGPVVAILLVMSVITLALILYKLWQMQAAGVGRHRALRDAVASWDRGNRGEARRQLAASRSYLVPVVAQAFERGDAAGAEDVARLNAEASNRLTQLESGFRFLDMIAQIAPLLGLFGTVLGMIGAFQALQDAGSQVDPSLLAGGIWVALLTTAVGLGVAMPASVILSWFESRMLAEREIISRAIATVVSPDAGGEPSQLRVAHDA